MLTLSASGNPAAIVATTSRGVVFDGAAALSAFFTSGKALEYAQARRRTTAQAETLLWTGTSATLKALAGPITIRQIALAAAFEWIAFRGVGPDFSVGSAERPARRRTRGNPQHLKPA